MYTPLLVNGTSWRCLLFLGHLIIIALTTLGSTSDESGLAGKLERSLIENGFENVSVILEDGRAIVTYENRIYRHEMRAIREAMATLLPAAEEGLDITLVPQNTKTSLVAITIPADVCLSLLNGEASDEEFASTVDVSLDVDSTWREAQRVQKANSSLHKLDIVVYPQFRAQFGDYGEPVRSQLNLVPEINIVLWKGMSLAAQLIIPLQNDLGGEGNHWRPGLLTVNQTLRLPRNTFISATLGYFTLHRYGTDLEIKKYFANGRWSIRANVGYNGFATYRERIWYLSDIGILTTLFNAEYRFSPFDLSLRVTYGKFLHQDKGWRFDILRQFGEVDIGFFAIKTEVGTNGGFNFSMPIFPPRYLPTWYVRISPAKEFPFEYRYKRFQNSGVQYDTGKNIDKFMKRLNPDYIKNQMIGFCDLVEDHSKRRQR